MHSPHRADVSTLPIEQELATLAAGTEHGKHEHYRREHADMSIADMRIADLSAVLAVYLLRRAM